ncbi:hypothetical protein [Asticcacaulis solisilvae]|uniref:hypothetical protein n=1 Tax=Asticcacaulis solisilvae TaxID=1217274 RepID=UPI003FD7ED80
MTNKPSFASLKLSYRPWGQVRRRNLTSRILYVASMSLLGLGILAGLALLFVFAASVAVVGVIAGGLLALASCLFRTPARIFVRSQRDNRRDNGKGVYEARKQGSGWRVY